MADREKLRAELRQILDKPIFPREGIDPIEAVTDYLLDNDVLPVVRCKDCKWYCPQADGTHFCKHPSGFVGECGPLFFCAAGERREAASNG